MLRRLMLTTFMCGAFATFATSWGDDAATGGAARRAEETAQLKQLAADAMTSLAGQDFRALERMFDPSFAPLHMQDMRELFQGKTAIEVKQLEVKEVEFRGRPSIREEATAVLTIQLAGQDAQTGAAAFPDYPITARVAFTRDRTGSSRQWRVENIYLSVDRAVVQHELAAFYEALGKKQVAEMTKILSQPNGPRPKAFDDYLRFPGTITVKNVELHSFSVDAATCTAVAYFDMTAVGADGGVARSPMAQEWRFVKNGWQWKAVDVQPLAAQTPDDPFGF